MGFQNGTLNIDAGGNVTVIRAVLLAPSKVLVSSPLRKRQLRAGRGSVDGANWRYSRCDGAVLTLEGDAADLAALQDVRSRSC